MQAWWKVTAAYRRVYDSRHRQADWLPRTGISSGTLRSVIEYGLSLPFFTTRISQHTPTPSKGEPTQFNDCMY